MKMCHVYYYNNSDATCRLLMSGDINPNPGPVSASTAGKINCLVMNAGSLKSYHKDRTTNWQSAHNLHRFQNLVYAENSDVICVNKTWLKSSPPPPPQKATLKYCILALQYLGFTEERSV